jgi:uncharacterized protein (TIGR03067 family)
MKQKLLSAFFLGALCVRAGAADGESGFQNIFNGKDLTGWDGNRTLWSVKDGAIVGQTTTNNPIKANTFLIWTNDTPADFELRFSYAITPNNDKGFANSGVQYRSKILDPANWVVGGYQADFEAGDTYSGILYEERMRGILAERGQKVVVKEADGKMVKDVVGAVGKSEEIQAAIKKDGWNDYVVRAQGNHLQHFINGRPTVDVTDEAAAKAAKSGVLALQLHAGPPMTVQFKNLRLKNLSGGAGAAADDLRKLQGAWEVASAEMNGGPMVPDDLGGTTVTIRENTYQVAKNTVMDHGRFTVVADRQPKAMDIHAETGPWAGRVLLAIYEVTADTLRVCYAVEGSKRPKVFTTEPDSGRLVITYKRKQP